jgi:hypothetical protein
MDGPQEGSPHQMEAADDRRPQRVSAEVWEGQGSRRHSQGKRRYSEEGALFSKLVIDLFGNERHEGMQ